MVCPCEMDETVVASQLDFIQLHLDTTLLEGADDTIAVEGEAEVAGDEAGAEISFKDPCFPYSLLAHRRPISLLVEVGWARHLAGDVEAGFDSKNRIQE